MKFDKAKQIIKLWADEGLINIRFSGGEPTLYDGIVDLVEYTQSLGVKRIAISTNGSAPNQLYRELIRAGVNDFSISLDACCGSFAEKMAGGICGTWEKVVDNIKYLSKLSYVSVGVVVTEDNIHELENIVVFADNLGVSDIRIISSAQFNKLLDNVKNIDDKLLNRHKILNYRVKNIRENRNVRGLRETDSHKCGLALDDMAIAGKYHFPCIIYMREGGNPIGVIGKNMRLERLNWLANHDTQNDVICKNNCLDVCIDYNNKFDLFHWW